MHGVKKADYKAKQENPAIAAALVKKARQYNLLCKEVQSYNITSVSATQESSNLPKKELSNIVEKILLVNPDPNYLWNYRRKLISVQDSDDETIFLNELELTASCLKRNPKVYGTWTYRKWIIHDQVLLHKTRNEKNESLKLLNNELKLCGDFLKLDERNFHCWNYRRYIVSAIGAISCNLSDFNGAWDWIHSDKNNSDFAYAVMSPQIITSNMDKNLDEVTATQAGTIKDLSEILQVEWDFTTTKIQKNFSNYSAFHYRSKLFPLYMQNQLQQSSSDKPKYEVILETSREEIDLLNNAIFTEPDDQTPWWYYRFILSWISPSSTFMQLYLDDEATEMFKSLFLELLQNECLSSIQELVEAEDHKIKWGMLGLLNILDILLHCTSHDDSFLEERKEWLDCKKDCIQKLIDIDPDRIHRYEHMLQHSID